MVLLYWRDFLWYPEGTPIVPRPRYTYIIIWEYYIYNIPPASSFPPLQFVLGEKSVAFQVFFQGLSLFSYNLPLPDPFFRVEPLPCYCNTILANCLLCRYRVFVTIIYGHYRYLGKTHYSFGKKTFLSPSG